MKQKAGFDRIPNTCHYYSADQNIRFRMTTPEEETGLFEKARGGDEVAREFLITNHLLFAAMEAQKLVKGYLPRNEVISAANFAVMKAFEAFDFRRGLRFTAYLRPFIRGEIASLWRSKFNSCNIPDPSISLSAEAANDVTEGEVFACSDPLDPSPREEHPAEENDFRQYVHERLTKALKRLPEADQKIIQQVHFEEKSYSQIAREANVSREAIRAKHQRIVNRLKFLLSDLYE